MQRQLILMRHAKSSWSSGVDDDHARPLNKRGKRDAPRVARAIAARGWVPELVWSSSSKRTRQTWKRMAAELDGDIEVVLDDRYYHGGLSDLVESASAWPSAVGTVLVLGHNPGWESALYRLTGISEPMTTANAALLIGHGARWRDALSGRWELVALLRPRELSE